MMSFGYSSINLKQTIDFTKKFIEYFLEFTIFSCSQWQERIYVTQRRCQDFLALYDFFSVSSEYLCWFDCEKSFTLKNVKK